VAFEGDVNILSNTIKVGDYYVMNNLYVGTSSVYDFSGQYKVDSVGLTNSYVYFNVNNNSNKTSTQYGGYESLVTSLQVSQSATYKKLLNVCRKANPAHRGLRQSTQNPASSFHRQH
jgi:hypothetical protein